MVKNKQIIEARSKENGIVFYSNTNPLVGSETFLDEHGNIHNKLILTRLDEMVDYLGTLSKEKPIFNKKSVILFDIVLIIISIIITFLTGNFGLVMGALYFSAFASFDLSSFLKAIYTMKYTSNGSTARFHSAEHMAVNAYETLQKVPSLEEIKKFSRFSKSCGSRIILFRIFIYSAFSLALALFSTYHSIMYSISIALILIFSFIEKKYGFLYFLQIFITSKPTDKELTLAIEGLHNFETMEESLKDGKTTILATLELPFMPTGILNE